MHFRLQVGIKENTPDITQWYEGDDNSLSFEKYMKAKINKKEAFIAIDENKSCCGVIAVSKANNNITFFAISHKSNFYLVGNLLLEYALSLLN